MITLPDELTLTVAPCPVDVTIGILLTVTLLSTVGTVTLVNVFPFIKLPLDKAPSGIRNTSPTAYPEPEATNSNCVYVGIEASLPAPAVTVTEPDAPVLFH